MLPWKSVWRSRSVGVYLSLGLFRYQYSYLTIGMESRFHARKTTFQSWCLVESKGVSNPLESKVTLSNSSNWHHPCKALLLDPSRKRGEVITRYLMNPESPGVSPLGGAREHLKCTTAVFRWAFGHPLICLQQEMVSECQTWRSQGFILRAGSRLRSRMAN